jgi:hypothetical protein
MTHAISRTALIALNPDRSARFHGAVRTPNTPIFLQEKS